MKTLEQIQKAMRCGVCRRKTGDRPCMAFFEYDERYIGFPLGFHVLMDLECYLSYLAQYYSMTVKDIDEYLKLWEN